MCGTTVRIMREPGCEDLPLPAYQTEGAAGLDLLAAVDAPVVLRPGDVALISTGIRVSIPPGFEGQVRPRSGLALKHGIGILNAPGTVDSDYRGVVGVILFNFGKADFTVARGDRIDRVAGPAHEMDMLLLAHRVIGRRAVRDVGVGDETDSLENLERAVDR